MAHAPTNPDETIPPHMHGFDPLPKRDAIKLVNEFSHHMTAQDLYSSQMSFYLDAATLTALLQGQRNECTYDGFHIMFGLNKEANDQLVLLIHRVRASVNNCESFNYENVPQRVAVEVSHRKIQIIDFAVMPVNDNGFAKLYRINREGVKYNEFRKRYQDKFDNKTTGELFTEVSATSPKELPAIDLVTGYFIGWGVLDLIRKELNSKIGIKLFLGYGSVSLNVSSVRCLHLVAMAADNSQAQIQEYPSAMVWSTQDQTKPEMYILDHNDDPHILHALSFPIIGTLGSSCAFAIYDKV